MNKIIHSDCIQGMKELPDNSVDCCVTSPPYYGLRDYGHDGQIGLEETPEQYVAKMVEVFEQVRRVLKPEGTLWLNLGDSYAREGGDSKSKGRHLDGRDNNPTTGSNRYAKDFNLKPKDLIGIPWMVAFALRSAGWYLRQDIIWHKPNPMPESVTDRCTKAHEYIFLMSKSQRYYYDQEAIKQPIAEASIERLSQDVESQEGSSRVPGKSNGNMKAVGRKEYTKDQAGGGSNITGHSGGYRSDGSPQEYLLTGKANKRSVWTVTTKPFKEAHFATFPEDLIVDCIKAGCPEGGTVLDPFGGAGTTAVVARKLNRNYLLYELNPEYIKIAEKRIFNSLGLFA